MIELFPLIKSKPFHIPPSKLPLREYKKAQRYITFLQNLLAISPTPSILRSSDEVNTLRSSQERKPIENIYSDLFSPLKAILKDSLQDYIPPDSNTLDGITDETLTLFSTYLSSHQKL